MIHTSNRPILRLPIVAFMVGGLSVATVASAETWTNLRGTNSIEAEMVGLWGDRVVLDTGDGRRIAVALEDLRAESRIRAEKLAKSKDEAREARIGELKVQSDLAAAPAPVPLPSTPPATPYTPPTNSADVAAHFTAVDEQLRAGHLIAIFDALPTNFQKELDELAKLAASKVSETTWQSVVQTAHRLGDVIVTKQNWFFSHPRFDVEKSSAPESTKRLNDTILALANMLRSGIDVNEFELAKVSNSPLRQWLAERDSAIAPHLAAIFRASGVAPPTFTAEQAKGKSISMQIARQSAQSTEPITTTINLTMIDNVFVPTSIADTWKNVLPPMRKTLETSADGSMLSDPTTVFLLSAIGPLVGQLEAAKNRNDFHAAMQPLIELVAPTLPALKQNLGSGS